MSGWKLSEAEITPEHFDNLRKHLLEKELASGGLLNGY